MKASEMTNEELAKELMSRVPLDSNRHDDIREAAATVAQEMLNTSMQDITAERINGWAMRLAEACEQPVTDCNQLGNAAKMREALEKIASMGEQIDYQLGSSEETVYALRHERCLAHNISECARSALSATPRNCDALSKDEVLEILDDRSFSKEDTIEWLYEEAKGETK